MESEGMDVNTHSMAPLPGNAPEQDVFQRLLLAKTLLSEIDVVPTIRPDSFTVARYILIAHYASELVLAAIARHLDCLPPDNEAYLMKYVGALKQKTGNDIPYRSFFSQLNYERTGIKHRGSMPNVDEWGNVAEIAHRSVSTLCEKYLAVQLSQLDESILMKHEEAKGLIAEAKNLYKDAKYQAVLEKIAHALFVLFRDNPALRNMTIGEPDAEDAIKLTAFGVNANEFLALQEFLPSVSKSEDKMSFRWTQGEYGHPANWTDEAADFCLKTVVHVAVRIQNASWIPSAIPFGFIYDQKVTALEDGVKIVQDLGGGGLGLSLFPASTKEPPKVVRILSKGESLMGQVERKKRYGGVLMGFQEPGPEMLTFLGREAERIISGDIETGKISVTCVPRQNEFVKKYYPNLREIPWEPS